MLRLRNDESYHYNQESAIELCQMIPELLPYFDDLKEKIITFGYASIDSYGASVRGKEESDDIRHCFHLENESSGGDITLYRVFPYSIFPNTSPSPAWIKRSARLSIGVVDLLISTSLCPL